MRPVATYVARSAVCVSVSVYWSHGCTLQKWLNRSRCRLGGLTFVGPRNHVLDAWGLDPPQEGAIFGVVWPIEKHWVYAAKGIIQSSITVWYDSGTAAAVCNAPDCSLSHYIVSCEKSFPAKRPIIKFLWPFFSINVKNGRFVTTCKAHNWHI